MTDSTYNTQHFFALPWARAGVRPEAGYLAGREKNMRYRRRNSEVPWQDIMAGCEFSLTKWELWFKLESKGLIQSP